jgi:hypothetical protein
MKLPSVKSGIALPIVLTAALLVAFAAISASLIGMSKWRAVEAVVDSVRYAETRTNTLFGAVSPGYSIEATLRYSFGGKEYRSVITTGVKLDASKAAAVMIDPENPGHARLQGDVEVSLAADVMVLLCLVFFISRICRYYQAKRERDRANEADGAPTPRG